MPLPPDGLEVDMFVLQASRAEVEARDISKAAASLYELVTPKECRRMRRKLVFEITGYSNDPRDLWEFPEVCKWMKDLDQQWPFWFFFMHLGEHSTLSMVTFCLCPWVKVPNGKLIEEHHLIPFVRRHIQMMLGLCDKLAMDRQTMTAMTAEILEYYSLTPEAVFHSEGGVQ